MNNDSPWKLFTFILLDILFIFIVCAIINDSKTNTTTSPVGISRIDSITKENNELIIEVENLDSIKDAKVIEVSTLDNDSTLKLFYKLVSE